MSDGLGVVNAEGQTMNRKAILAVAAVAFTIAAACMAAAFAEEQQLWKLISCGGFTAAALVYWCKVIRA